MIHSLYNHIEAKCNHFYSVFETSNRRIFDSKKALRIFRSHLIIDPIIDANKHHLISSGEFLDD